VGGALQLYLSLLFNCHINVEVYTSVAVVKYLYKYIYKGHDRAQVDVGPVDVVAPDGVAPVQPCMRDEIKIYQDDRYVLASEASHCLYGFDQHKEHSNVIRLAMHLKGRQTILFQEGTDAATVLNRNPHTTLIAWFAFNKTAQEHLNPSAPLRLALNTLYHDFPHIATWKNKEKQWALRTRTPGLLLVGRMYFVQPVVRIHIAYQHTLLPCQFTAMLESKYRETLTPKDSNNQCYQSSQPNLQLQGRHKGLGAPHTLSTHTRGYGRGTQEGSTSQNEPFLPWWLRYTPWASAWPKALSSDWRSKSNMI